MHDPDAVSKYRSEVIERAINVEWLIAAIICQHYFGKLKMSFLLEVLYDEYFSFALKRRILEKIVPAIDMKKIQDLNRIGTIRNYFAHCNQIISESPDPTAPGAIHRVADPRNPKKSIDFEKLYTEANTIFGPLEEYLGGIFTELGGEFKSDEDFKSAGT